MTINGYTIGNPTVAVFDGCHKIFIPVEGHESVFVKKMEEVGWDWKEDFYKLDSANNLLAMYLDSCPLRFIQQFDFIDGEEIYTNIIPQCDFTDEDGFFDGESARAAFVE